MSELAIPFLDSKATIEIPTFYGFTWDEIQELNELPVRPGAAPMGPIGFLPGHCGNGYYPIYVRCNLKFCPVCRKIRAQRMIEEYSPLVKSYRAPRFITFTYPNQLCLTKVAVRKMANDWTKMRTWLVRSGLVKSGLIAKECTYHEIGEPMLDRYGMQRRDKTTNELLFYTEKNTGFHYHFHILFDGAFIDYRLLREKWQKITGSTIIDIRMLRGNVQNGLRYMLKYLSKEGKISNFSALKEYLLATQGERQIQVFGNKKPPKRRYHFVCPDCGYELPSRFLRSLIVKECPRDATIIRSFPYEVWYDEQGQPPPEVKKYGIITTSQQRLDTRNA